MDVLVVGAGPTGLTMAAELAARGVSYRVVDRAPVRSDKSRALGVQARTLELFQKMGIADELVASGQRAAKVTGFVRRRRAYSADLSDIGALNTPYPFLLFVSQVETERALERRLERLGGKVERPVELIGFAADGEGVIARLRHADGREEEVRARYLVGCDGAHSVVRKQAGLRFDGSPYPQGFLLADVELGWEYAPGEAYVFLDDTGVLIAFPLPGASRFRLIASRRSDVNDGDDPTLAEIQALADEMVPTPVVVRTPRWLARFRLHHRSVDRYRAGRAFVAGDAAHIHSPAGGQGMNTGIQDAYNLAWKMALVVRDGASERLLDSYHEERYPIGQRLLRTTDRLFAFAAPRSRALIALRNFMVPKLVPFLLGSPARRRRAFRFISELSIRYRRSPIVAEDVTGADRAFLRGPRAGDRAPDGPLQRLDDGREDSLFAQLQSGAHHLIVFAGPSAPAPPGADLATTRARALEAFSGLGAVEVHLVVGRTPDRAERGALLDVGGALHRIYGQTGAAVVLIRPDGYIAYRARGLKIDAAAAHLRRVLR